MFEINKIDITNATQSEKEIISKGKIEKIDKGIVPKWGSPGITKVNEEKDYFKFKNQLTIQLNEKKLNYEKQNNNPNVLSLTPSEQLHYQELSNQGIGKEVDFIKERFELKDSLNNFYGVGKQINHIYCIFGKYQLKKSVLKVTKPDSNIPTNSVDLLAIYTKAYQHMYKEQERWLENKKIKSFQNSPHGIYKYGIQDIHYTGLSTVIEFDSFLVISFDVEH